ncbi:MAG: histidine--tRNA ligase [Saprospiraceae bacterium]|nr:histidine--tRNA ligase [Saprospiraceae bacterium]
MSSAFSAKAVFRKRKKIQFSIHYQIDGKCFSAVAKPSLPKGTRDFLPVEVNRRKYIFDIVERVFRKYGFLPIETPAMESLETLLGKYGDEGDKLLFKVLNNGDYLKDADEKAYENKDSFGLVKSISKRGLRYDLTVPFARFVVMNQNEIQLPFKRYQIQPVWRADKPQKGRYQEFFQCDVDVVGSESLLYEAELVCIYHEIFKTLGIHVHILINNRKILFGLAEAAGLADKFMEMTVAIDKLDKIGRDGVMREMAQRDITAEQAETVLHLLEVKSIDELAGHPAFQTSETGMKGVAEVRAVFDFLAESDIHDLIFDVSLARGLSYYTGCIFEVKVDTQYHPSISMGSIGGGGRYDNLTGAFGLPGVSGVGVSLGAERIYDVLSELSLFPATIDESVPVIFLCFDAEGLTQAFRYAMAIRTAGIACEVYPEAKPMKKQMKYANDRAIPYVAILGANELQQGTISLKDMITGNQTTVKIEDLITALS